MEICGEYCKASQMPMVCARQAFDERPRNRSSPDEGSEAPATVAPLWADVPVDILGTVLGFLPCAADRASVRSVCRHWRAATRVQTLPAPLPVLVLPRFRFSCLTSDGSLTVPRRALMMPVELAGDDARIVGSYDDWLVASRPSRLAKETGAECFLVRAFSSEVVHLPCLQESPTQGFFNGTKDQESWMVLCNAVLSASPSSGSKYIVAALSYHIAEPGLALWQPGMTTWCLHRDTRIDYFMSNLAFYEGKLYVVCRYTSNTTNIFAFELREDKHGVSLSCTEQYKIDPLITPPNSTRRIRCNMVVWRGKLLLIIRHFSDATYCKPHSVEVFALDFSTQLYGFTKIHNLHGDCIFVDTYGCRPYTAGLHVGVQGDLIYFACIGTPYVYNMRDGTVRHIAASLPEGGIGFPFWIFPSS